MITASTPERDGGLRDPVGGWLWFAVTGALVVALPSFARRGVLPWLLAAPEVLQVIVMTGCYFGLSTYVVNLRHRRPPWAALRATGAAIVLFAAAYASLAMFPEFTRSRVLFGLTTLFAVVFAVVPVAAQQARAAAVGGALLVAATFGAYRTRDLAAAGSQAAVTQVPSSLAHLEVRLYAGLTGPTPLPRDGGGGIAAWRDGFLVMTAKGLLYRVTWDSARTSLRSAGLSLPPPMDQRAFLADQPDTSVVLRYRVTAITLDTLSSPARLYASHEWWNHEKRCFTLRVSSFPLDAAGAPTSGGAWRPEFETRPCVGLSKVFDDIETGGRLAWAGRSLLLTTGDFGMNGLQAPSWSQDTTTDYGKVFRRDPDTGRWRMFTIGHRNPQGLMVDHEGRIWETEHGPQGGDEINVLVQGRNYGWPVVTYGTEYGTTLWPLNPLSHDHGEFTEPAYAFVPSIGISNLIEVDGPLFPEWRNDLLVSSLRGKALFRVRRRGDHIIYAENIPIGRRIRDLAQSTDGRIVLWTDGGTLVTVGRRSPTSSPEAAFGQCAACHVPSIQGLPMGPNLHGVFGRTVAGAAGYDYSGGLKRMGGTWTAERLDAFLESPATFAPGTAMQFGGVANRDERRMVIEYLRGYH